MEKHQTVLILCVPVSLLLLSEFGTATTPEIKSQSSVKYLVGVITEQHVQICLGNQQEEWIDPHFQAGFVRLVLAPNINLSPMNGSPVLLSGKIDASMRFTHPGHKGDCPGRQARNDWIFSKNGVRLLRTLPEGMTRPDSFFVDKAMQYYGITVRRVGENLRFGFTNTLSTPLADVEIILHYEGCYRKPSSTDQRKSFSWLDVGETASVEFPVNLKWSSPAAKQPNFRRELHIAVAHSVQVAAKDKSVLFDLDLPLTYFPDVKVECLKRDTTR